TSWLYPLLHHLAPRHTTTTEHIGRAMLAVTRPGATEQRILYSPEINRLGGESETTATKTG
ncbi:epimerase, partial [Streptomyces sp. NPDC004227]